MTAQTLLVRDRHRVVHVLAIAIAAALLAYVAVEALAALANMLGLMVLHDVGVNTGPLAAAGGAAAGAGAGGAGSDRSSALPEPPPPPLPSYEGGPPEQRPYRDPNLQAIPLPTLWSQALDWLSTAGATTPDPSNVDSGRHAENEAAHSEESLLPNPHRDGEGRGRDPG